MAVYNSCKEPEDEIGRQLIIRRRLWLTPQSICDLTPPTQTNAHKDQTTTPGTTSPTLYEQWVDSLTSHRVITNKGSKTGPTVYRPYPEKTRKSNHFQMSLQRQHFLLSHFKTLSGGPARVSTHDLPHGSPKLYQLSQLVGC